MGPVSTIVYIRWSLQLKHHLAVAGAGARSSRETPSTLGQNPHFNHLRAGCRLLWDILSIPGSLDHDLWAAAMAGERAAWGRGVYEFSRGSIVATSDHVAAHSGFLLAYLFKTVHCPCECYRASSCTPTSLPSRFCKTSRTTLPFSPSRVRVLIQMCPALQ